MKIIQAKVEKHNMQLKAPWAIAGHVHESIENIFIEITDVNGLTGIGSCAPMNDSKENYNHYFKTLDELFGKDLSKPFFDRTPPQKSRIFFLTNISGCETHLL